MLASRHSDNSELLGGIGPAAFVHKRIIGGITGALTGGLGGAVTGFLRPGGNQHTNSQARPRPENGMGIPGRVDFYPIPSGTNIVPGTNVSAQTIPCIPPFFRNTRTGKCELDLVPGAGGGGTGADRDDERNGAVRNGRSMQPGFRGGYSPAIDMVKTRDCEKGDILADDGLCYDKRLVPNNRREWPRPRRPLLTGGDMNAITKAAAAGKRLNNAEKRLKQAAKDLGGVGKSGRGRR